MHQVCFTSVIRRHKRTHAPQQNCSSRSPCGDRYVHFRCARPLPLLSAKRAWPATPKPKGRFEQPSSLNRPLGGFRHRSHHTEQPRPGLMRARTSSAYLRRSQRPRSACKEMPFSTLATRKPLLLIRAFAARLIRTAERSHLGRLSHDPPRSTRASQLVDVHAVPSDGAPA